MRAYKWQVELIRDENNDKSETKMICSYFNFHCSGFHFSTQYA